jgi:hypothetical protein
LQAFDVRLFNEVQVLILQLSAQAGAEAGCRRPPTGRNSLPAGGNTTNQLPPPADRQEFPACRRKYYKPIGAKDFFAVQMTFELRLNWNPEYGDDRNIPCGRQIPDWYQSAESRNSGGLVVFPRGPNL